jgi:LmbE family N-acetylglucosaminyl deacetylase
VTSAILSPHPDDAVLSCWHLLAGDDEVCVINVFSGTPAHDEPLGWWDRLTGAADATARMAERLAEDRRALALAGRAASNLGLLDAQYRGVEPALGPLVGAVAQRVDPGTRLLAPAALGDHPDHELVRAAALELRARGFPVALYADLPHALQRGSPRWVSENGSSAGPDRTAAIWRRTLAATGIAPHAMSVAVHRLGRAVHARKLEALGAYRTQLAGLDALTGGALDDPASLGYEVVWMLPLTGRRSGAAPASPPGLPRRRSRR